MSEMVERVARMLDPGAFNMTGGDSADQREDARIMARIAIEAMRVPTKEMEDAYLAACDKSGACLWRTAYRVLIDAALHGNERKEHQS